MPSAGKLEPAQSRRRTKQSLSFGQMAADLHFAFLKQKTKNPSPCTIILTSKFIFFIFPNLIIIPLSYNQITEPNTMISCRCWLVSASCMNKTCDCGVKLKFANHALVFLSFSEMLLLVFWWWVKLMPSSGKLHAAPKAPAPQGHQSF